MGFLQEFDFPVSINKDCDYLGSFCDKMDSFVKKFEKLPSDDSGFFKHLLKYPHILEEIKTRLRKNKGIIVKAFNNYLNGNIATAAKQIENLICKNKDSLITEIKSSHAFLDEGFFFSKGLSELYLFKGRVGNTYCTFNPIEMAHIPLNLRSLVETQRFSQPGVPCIYLASNSYIVWKELNCPQYDKLCVSAFNVKCIDRKIIDLTYSFARDICYISDETIVDEELMTIFADSISIYPLVLACSFICDETNRKFKSEYVIPQLVMQSIKKVNCLGVAYRSNKVYSDHNLPATNLAIPIYERLKEGRYGSILKEIDITDSANFGYFVNNVFKQRSLTFSKANGFCGKTRNFNPNFPNLHSTFNNYVCSLKSSISYDGILSYMDTSFFEFDEFILFHNKLKKFNPITKEYN